MSKTYIYHHNDHDGIVAAGVLLRHLNDAEFYMRRQPNIECIMIDYDKELNFDHIDFEDLDQVYFLDYSFSNKHNLDEFEKLLKRRIIGDEVVWIDHHKTSLGVFDEYSILGVRNKALCGAAWTWLYCEGFINSWKKSGADLNEKEISDLFHRKMSVPTFLKYIDDYDCWKNIYPETNDFHYGLTISDPYDNSIGGLLLSYDDLRDIINRGKDIQKYLDFENQNYHVDMYGFEFTLPEEHGGLKCFCLNRKGNSIMFGNKINEYDAVIPFYYVNSKWKYSIFSNKDHVDCSEVAKSFGGGGHKGAAGWVSDELIFENTKKKYSVDDLKITNRIDTKELISCPYCHTKPSIPQDFVTTQFELEHVKKEISCKCGFLKIYI